MIKCLKCGQSPDLMLFRVYGKVLCYHCALDIPPHITPTFNGHTPIADLLPDCAWPGEFSLKNKNILRYLEIDIWHNDPRYSIEEVFIDDMAGWGTSCGDGEVRNRAFKPGVIAELKKYCDHAIASVVNDEDGCKRVCTLILPVLATGDKEYKMAKKIQGMINRNKGSFEAHVTKGVWVLFESE